MRSGVPGYGRSRSLRKPSSRHSAGSMVPMIPSATFSSPSRKGRRCSTKTNFSHAPSTRKDRRHFARTKPASGKQVPVFVNAILRRSDDGTSAGMLLSVFDAVQRRLYEKELLRARKRPNNCPKWCADPWTGSFGWVQMGPFRVGTKAPDICSAGLRGSARKSHNIANRRRCNGSNTRCDSTPRPWSASHQRIEGLQKRRLQSRSLDHPHAPSGGPWNPGRFLRHHSLCHFAKSL